MIIAERGGVVLRHLQAGDWPQVSALVITCYAPIQASYVAMLGEECYQAVRHNPELTWEQRKIGQVRRLYDAHPEQVWVLEQGRTIIGFATFEIVPEKSLGVIANNGIHPDHAGRGWGKFIYRRILQHFRDRGLRFAFVDTGLDDAHIPARRAYEAVGFDRQAPIVEYWQDLSRYNPGSVPECRLGRKSDERDNRP